MLRIIKAELPEQIAQVKRLVQEYAASLPIDLCFQHYDEEIGNLGEIYGKPAGALFLAMMDGETAGCVGARKISSGVCEMKRWYVRPRFQGKGIGKALLDEVVRFARETGYAELRLDTLSSMEQAIRMYRNFGFKEIEPYYINPNKGAIFFSLDLTS